MFFSCSKMAIYNYFFCITYDNSFNKISNYVRQVSKLLWSTSLTFRSLTTIHFKFHSEATVASSKHRTVPHECGLGVPDLRQEGKFACCWRYQRVFSRLSHLLGAPRGALRSCAKVCYTLHCACVMLFQCHDVPTGSRKHRPIHKMPRCFPHRDATLAAGQSSFWSWDSGTGKQFTVIPKTRQLR